MENQATLQAELPQWAALAQDAPPNAQAEAVDFIKTRPLPTTRKEFWKYTRLSKFKNASLNFGSQPKTLDLPPRLADAQGRLVLVNGVFSKGLSDIEEVHGLKVSEGDFAFDYAEEIPDRIYFKMLNRALPTATLKLELSATKQETSLEILHVITQNHLLIQPGIFAQIAPEAQCRIYEHFHVSAEAKSVFFNGLHTLKLDQNSGCNWTLVQTPGSQNAMVQNSWVSQDAHSRFTLNTLSFDAELIRNNVWVFADQPQTQSRLNGITLCGGKSHIDHHTFMDHRAPHTDSYENYRAVLGGQSTAVFNGKVMVRPNAQKINAYQNNRNMLLSDTARVNTKPELEIYADDVKCSHGSTTGRLNEEALFYLRARGISERTAIKLLIDAFFIEILSDVPSEVQRFLLQEQVRHHLEIIA
jgi:Fe-S cluster assembly protein SufD